MTRGRHSRIAALGLLATMAGCTAQQPSPGSPTLGQPDVPSTTPTSTASARPLDLDGTILIGLDTMYIGDASATELEPLFPAGSYGGIFRISPDRTQILTLPGNEEVGNVTPPPVPPGIVVQGGLLDIASGRFTVFPQPDPTLTLVPQVFCQTAAGLFARAGTCRIPLAPGCIRLERRISVVWCG